MKLNLGIGSCGVFGQLLTGSINMKHNILIKLGQAQPLNSDGISAIGSLRSMINH